MRKRNVKKWLLYIAIIFTVLSSFLFIPPMQGIVEYGEIDTAMATITAPQSVEPIDYNMPKNRIANGLEESSQAAIREEAGERYLLYRFLTMAFSLWLFLCYIYRAAIRRFSRYKTALWRDVIYIHKSDGKKRMAFCNE